jgi:hypothetical protein
MFTAAIQMEIKEATETKVNQLEATVTQLKDQLQKQESLLISVSQRERPAATSCKCLTDVTAARGSSIDGIGRPSVTLSGIPSSCEDLGLIGHTLSGLYSVMGTEQVETVYCDFSKLPNEPSKLL